MLVKTEMYIICATYTRGMYPSVCVEAVEKLGEYWEHFIFACLKSIQ